jgi:hypothetical protein
MADKIIEDGRGEPVEWLPVTIDTILLWMYILLNNTHIFSSIIVEEGSTRELIVIYLMTYDE